LVKLNRIYTRTGDTGTSGLVDGTRRPKQDALFEAVGTVDEANSLLGVVRSAIEAGSDEDAMLSRIQNDLFDLGADLATPAGSIDEAYALRIAAAQVERLEREIDRMNETLAPLTSFILPAGAPAVAYLHLGRAVVRRAERVAWGLAASDSVNTHALTYLNRLSDHLFVLARALSARSGGDVLWVPGKNR
jgi:cob(I)alamin adenosyltransferase